MDPLSIIASVFSIYQVASHLTGQLFRYARGIKHAEAEANTFLGEIRHFQGALEELSSLLQDEADTTGTSDRLKAIRDITSHDSLLLKNCKTDLEELERRLDEDEITQGGLKGQAKALLNKLKWPLKEEEIRKIIDNMRTVSAQIQKAQTMDTMRMVRAIDSTTKEINETTKATEQAVAFVKTAIVDAEAKQAAGEAKKKAEDKQKVWEETREKFVEWLVYPDPGENHNIACKAKNPAANTGEWFLDGDDFKRFKESDRALLWLDGNPGCGKTVLSSSIIENLVGELESNEQSAMAYWYFSSSGKATMSLDNCIRSLITQFMMAVSGKFPKAIDELWNNKGRKKETPKLSDLTYTLHSHLQEEKVKFYIIIDALDEAREEDHEDLLRFVQDLISNDMHGIGLVLTSRPFVKEKFKERFEDEANFFDIAIERASVDGDIKSHIQEQLTTDPNLSQWKEEVRNSILSALLEKAEGMFRWVECQLEALRKCKRKSAIDKVLSQLPKNLHEQYQRDLANIPEEDEESALTLLKWLAFPQRKLRVEEVADLIAVDWDVDEPFFDPDDRLRDPSLVIGLCGSLIRTDKNPEGFNSFGEKEEVTTLTTSHSTVLDFLTSEALKVGTLPEARLSRATVNLQMATSCLGYLNTLFTTEKEMTQLNRDKMTEYPCARLAAEYWDDYYREVVKDTKEKVDLTQINEMVISLFDNKEKLLKWVQTVSDRPGSSAVCMLYDVDYSDDPVNFDRDETCIHSPLYYAALLGLPDIVQHYLKEGVEVNSSVDFGFGTALNAAAHFGHKKVVEMLLEADADPNVATVYYWGSTLAVAVEANHTEIVQVLIKQPTIDVNSTRVPTIQEEKTADENSKTAEGIEQDEKNATVDEGSAATENGKAIGGNAAEGEETEDNEEEKKSEEEEEEEDDDDEEEEESEENEEKEEQEEHEKTQGAEAVDESGEARGETTEEGEDEWEDVDDEDEEGQDVPAATDTPKATGWEYDKKVAQESMVYICAAYDSPAALDILLEAGASPNLVGGTWCTPLQAALAMGNRSIALKLLEHGARADIYGGDYDSPLLAAVMRVANLDTELVQKLIDAGADVTRQAGPDASEVHSSTAIYLASYYSDEEVVKLLIDKGADVNTRGCWAYDNCLQAASHRGHVGIVKLLLEAGADKTHAGAGEYGSCLSAATSPGHAEVVQLLVDSGVSVDIRSSLNAYSICDSAVLNHPEITKILLKAGASPDSKTDDDVGCCLYLAASWGHTEVIKVLLEGGGDPNQETGELRYPLTVACQKVDDGSLDDLIEDLLKHGADPNLVSNSGQHEGVLPLMYSVQISTARLLLDHGADINGQSKQYTAPLTQAITKQRLEILEYFLERGADVQEYHPITGLPLSYASAFENTDIVKKLLEKADINANDNKNGTALHMAAFWGKEDSIDALLAAGADETIVYWLRGPVFMAACYTQDLDFVKKLGEKLKSRQGTNMIGHNALHVAIMKKNWGIAWHLLKNGFSMASTDKFGCNGLHYAARHAHIRLIRHAITKDGVDVNSIDNNSWTALHCAAVSSLDTARVIKILLTLGCDTSIKDKQGRTAADLAVGFGKAQEAALLRHGLSISSSLKIIPAAARTSPPWGSGYCDACGNSTGNCHHCQQCPDFDLCFRCYLNRDEVHFPDHELPLKSPNDDLVEYGLDEAWIPAVPDDATAPTVFVYDSTQEDRSLTIKAGTYTLGYKGIQIDGRAWFKADNPLILPKAYFEITIINLGNPIHRALAIGIATKDAEAVGMVGWKAGAWGYHSDDGKFFYQVGFGAEYGPTYKEGDTVGCGLDPALYEKDPNHPALFFTHNGKHLGSVFIDLHERPYPAVSLKGKKARFSVNFGEKEFVWKGAVYEGASADEAKEDEGEGEDGEEKDDDYNAEGQEEVKTDVADDQC